MANNILKMGYVIQKLEYKYPMLRKLSPSLYEWGFGIQLRLRHARFVGRHRDNIDPLTKESGVTVNILEEYNHVMDRISKAKARLSYPITYAISPAAGLFLYKTIRIHKPHTVLETGVANGFSTRIILEALNANKKGVLYSVEINKNVGGLLIDTDKKRWVLKVGKPRDVFSRTLKRLEKVDIFIHDGWHSYENMMYEFETVLPKIPKHGLLMSDDITVNNAFEDFYNKLQFKNKHVKFSFVVSPKGVGAFGCLTF